MITRAIAETSRPATTARPRRAAAAVPPAGPAWFGAVMGTAMLATLLQLMAGHVHGGVVIARVLLVVALALLIGLSIAFARRCLRDRTVLRGSFTGLVPMAQWGMVSMGVLALGSAVSTVLPAWTPALAHLAWSVDGVLWLTGSALGFMLALGFAVLLSRRFVPHLRIIASVLKAQPSAALLMRRDAGEPTTVWGLAVVPPMVTATTGAALSAHADGPLRALVLLVAIAGFATALGLGAIVFGVAYHHHWRVAPLPTALATSAWIPLGIVGQSVAAAQAISGQLQADLTPQAGMALAGLAHGYGAVVLLLGIPLIVWAIRVTIRGFRSGMAFSPGWWAMTFPVGTIVLGAHLLAEGTGWALASAAAVSGLAMLVGTWSLCTVASLRAVRCARRGRAATSSQPVPG